MWLFESDGDDFSGKTLWLRPGLKFLIGRTPGDEAGNMVIKHKTISRKHLIVHVSDVEPGDGLKPRLRSKVTLSDQETKAGTKVNDVQIRGKTHVLEGDSHVIRLGTYSKLFRLTWKPVNLTYSFVGKDSKSNVLENISSRLESLDIKVFRDYQPGITTHVVAKKRNTSKNLQALIEAKPIVTDDWVSAIEAVANEPDPERPDVAKLATDYMRYWPDFKNCLPEKGEEPTECGAEAYAPDPRRNGIFEGYTFIFYDKGQFDNLVAPITVGNGKALLREVEPEVSTTDDFVRYVKDTAGEKGFCELENGKEGKGVVLVRYAPKKQVETSSWYAKFIKEISLRLNLRMMEQNELLDVILKNDTSTLRTRLEVAKSGFFSSMQASAPGRPGLVPQSSEIQASNEPTPTNPEGDTTIVEEPPAEQLPPPQPRRRARRVVQSRFKGFDSDDSDDDDVKPATTQPEPESAAPTNLQTSRTSARSNTQFETAPTAPEPEESQDIFMSQRSESPKAVESQTQRPNMQSESQATQRNPRKRVVPPSDDEDDEDMLMSMAPAAAQLKRRRIEESDARRARGESTPTRDSETPAPEPEVKDEGKGKGKGRGKAVKKETAVEEFARQKREEAERLAKEERERLQETLGGVDIEKIRNLAIVEEMEVKRREPPPNRRERPRFGDESERWDEKWNGRKNFKKFRRQGEGGRSRVVGVGLRNIVPLEEVKRKDYGLGDERWEKRKGDEMDLDSPRRDRGKERERESQRRETQSQTPQSQTPRTETQGRRGATASAAPSRSVTATPSRSNRDAPIVLDDDDDDDEVTALEEEEEEEPVTQSAGRSTRAASKEPPTSSTLQSSATLPSQAGRKRTEPPTNAKQLSPKKRLARGTLLSATNRRKEKETEEEEDDDDDDDDGGMKFKFKKRR